MLIHLDNTQRLYNFAVGKLKTKKWVTIFADGHPFIFYKDEKHK